MGKLKRVAAAAHRAANGVTRQHFRAPRRPSMPPNSTPESIAHHEAGHAVLGWLYGAGFVHDPVVELGTSSGRQWGAVDPKTGARVHYVSTAVTHATRVTAPAGIPLNRFDVGTLRRLAVGLMAGPMAEDKWWAARGREQSFEELFGVSGATLFLDRNSDVGQAFELCAAVVILVSELWRTQQMKEIVLPANWFAQFTECNTDEVKKIAFDEVVSCAKRAAALLDVPCFAAAHHACVAHLDRGSLSQAALDAACAPLARLRVRPTKTIAREGRAAVIALMDPANRPSR